MSDDNLADKAQDAIKDALGGVFGGPDLAENQEATHQSGFSRLMNSILCALCCAPFLLIVAIFLWGWNEKRAVCVARALDQGKDNVVNIDCMDSGASSGKLVMFSCDIDKPASYETFTADGDFSGRVSFTGAGLKTVVEMYQCVETKTSETTKDKVGGGQTTVYTYNYNMAWSSKHETPTTQDSSKRGSMLTNCGVNSDDPNPAFPGPASGVPTPKTERSAKPLKVGAFSVDPSVYSASSVSLTTHVAATSVPTGWVQETDWYTTSKLVVPGNAQGLGKVHVKFYGSDDNTMLTLLGKNDGGKITPWKSEGTWLCSGESISDGRAGTYTKDELFSSLKSENTGLTWFLRILGFAIAWFAFSRLAGPCEVLADCIPCIGPYLGDFVEAVACFVAYFPACACCMFICAIVWAAMRPAVGVPLLLISLCMFGGFIAYKVKKAQDKGKAKEAGGDGNVDPDKVGATE